MDKEDVAHIYNGILLSHKKTQNWVICSEVDRPRVCHTEWSKSEREKHIPYICYHLYVESKKYNKPVNITKQKQTHRYREQTSGISGEREGGRDNVGEGD